MNINLKRATEIDAEELLTLQYKCFYPYIEKYGDFDSNPCHMELERMVFNINYHFGKYYKILDDDKIVGGIFVFELEENVYKIAQLYLDDAYRHLGIGTNVLKEVFEDNKNVTKWVADTIASENNNVKFYLNNGFSILDFDEEGDDLKFVIFMRKMEEK